MCGKVKKVKKNDETLCIELVILNNMQEKRLSVSERKKSILPDKYIPFFNSVSVKHLIV